MLSVLHHIPEGLLTCEPHQLYQVLSGPTLLDLAGDKEDALFVSTLLHGNETSGFYAIQQLLQDYQQRALPRRLLILFGNVIAARQQQRFLSGQPDYNRIWPGTTLFACHEVQMAQSLYQQLATQPLFACIDIHNTTGMNPHYACVNTLDHRALQLATLFNRIVVYFTRPKGVLTAAMAQLCPSVTLECGRNSQMAVQHAYEYVQACLHLDHYPEKAPALHDLSLYHTVAVVKVPDQVTFGFEQQESDICFRNDLDHLNFQELPAETPIATLYNPLVDNLIALNEQGDDVAEQFFTRQNGRLVTRHPVMPSMLTRDEQVIRQDCLGYLMARYQLAD